jgi:hypothetical protein
MSSSGEEDSDDCTPMAPSLTSAPSDDLRDRSMDRMRMLMMSYYGSQDATPVNAAEVAKDIDSSGFDAKLYCEVNINLSLLLSPHEVCTSPPFRRIFLPMVHYKSCWKRMKR